MSVDEQSSHHPCTLNKLGGGRCEAVADEETWEWERPMCSSHRHALRSIYAAHPGKVFFDE